MKDNKNTKTNANYFTKTENLKLVGIIVLIISGIEFFFGWSYIGYIISCAGLAVGVVLFIVGSSGRVSEAEMSEYITKHTEGACDFPEEDKALAKRLRKVPAPLSTDGFVFNEGVMIKKTKKGSLQSSVYSKAVIYPLDTALLIRRRTLLIATHEQEDDTLEIPYADITRLELSEQTEDITFNKKLFRAKTTDLIIETASGTSLLIPAQDNVETDAFMKDMHEILKGK